MPTVAQAREAIAAAVTTAGLDCSPYRLDTADAPAAWVASVDVDFTDGPAGTGSFCLSGMAIAAVALVAQRHDLPAAGAYLEDLSPKVVAALSAVGGLQILAQADGTLTVGGQELPAHVITVRFAI
jgi:hypothetical protein